jgi:dTDP-4-amino-4,6-dideoxygalactose transaminase
MSEVCALLGLMKLNEFEMVAQHRHASFERYRALLPEFQFQRMTGRRAAHQFASVLVPESHSGRVDIVIEALQARGVGAARYFVPHLAEQPFFQQTCVSGALPTTEAIARRIVALPMSDTLTDEDVAYVCDAFREACEPTAGIPSRRRTSQARVVGLRSQARSESSLSQ